MVIWGMVAWWYTEGWRKCLLGIKERIASTLDYFSIDLLVKTLFAPYRQIAAGQVKGSLDMQIQAFFDRLISRFIGMAVRSVLILVGSLTILLNVIFGGIILLFWALVPVLPLIGIVLSLSGWLPWNS